METNLPTPQQLRQWIKALTSEKEVLDKQISAYQNALDAQTLSNPKKGKRTRKKTDETVDLESKVQRVFQESGQSSLKLIDVMKAVTEMYPQEGRPDITVMRGRFNNLKKSNFLKADPANYGYYTIS